MGPTEEKGFFKESTKVWLDSNRGLRVLQRKPKFEVTTDIWGIIPYFQLKSTVYILFFFFVYVVAMLGYWSNTANGLLLSATELDQA